MFDAKTEVKSMVVAEPQLLPQLFVALVWSHAWLAPDMGEMSKLHQISFIVTVGAGQFRNRSDAASGEKTSIDQRMRSSKLTDRLLWVMSGLQWRFAFALGEDGCFLKVEFALEAAARFVGDFSIAQQLVKEFALG